MEADGDGVADMSGDRLATRAPTLCTDNGEQRMLQLVVDGRPVQQAKRDQLGDHLAEVVVAAERRRQRPPQLGGIAAEGASAILAGNVLPRQRTSRRVVAASRSSPRCGAGAVSLADCVAAETARRPGRRWLPPTPTCSACVTRTVSTPSCCRIATVEPGRAGEHFRREGDALSAIGWPTECGLQDPFFTDALTPSAAPEVHDKPAR